MEQSVPSVNITFSVTRKLCCLHMQGVFLDREDKKRSASMDMKPERHGLVDDYADDFIDVSATPVDLLRAHAYCCKIY